MQYGLVRRIPFTAYINSSISPSTWVNLRASLNNMNRILSIITIFISSNLFAQQSVITGTVTAEGEVSGAIVTLLKSTDSSVVKTTLCETNGNYTLSNLKAGSYLLSISHVGYIQYYTKTFSLGAGQQLQFEKISLLANSKELKEITVTAKK